MADRELAVTGAAREPRVDGLGSQGRDGAAAGAAASVWPGRLRAAALIVGLWVLVGLLRVNVMYFYLPLTGQPAYSWWLLLQYNLPEFLLWALLTPAIVELARRRPVFGPGWRANLGLHFLAALAAHAIVVTALGFIRHPPRPLPYSARMLDGTLFDIVLYSIVAAVANAMYFQASAQRQSTEALRLRSQLAESRLQALTLQLQPHFLFNALHGISELVYRDPRSADRALARLAELLRMALASSGQLEGTLDEEMRFLEAYAEIERMRAGGKLRLDVDVPAEARRLAVPVLILQPLVENAFRHGLRGGGGESVSVRARCVDGVLRIVVSNDGRDLVAGAPIEGVGLRNTRMRLETLYGERQGLTLRSRSGGGAEVELWLPQRRIESAAADGSEGPR